MLECTIIKLETRDVITASLPCVCVDPATGAVVCNGTFAQFPGHHIIDWDANGMPQAGCGSPNHICGKTY